MDQYINMKNSEIISQNQAKTDAEKAEIEKQQYDSRTTELINTNSLYQNSASDKLTELNEFKKTLDDVDKKYLNLNEKYNKTNERINSFDTSYTGLHTLASKINNEELPKIHQRFDQIKKDQDVILNELKDINDVIIPTMYRDIGVLKVNDAQLLEIQTFHTAHNSKQDVNKL
jgi:chromosome segregation ATPase